MFVSFVLSKSATSQNTGLPVEQKSVALSRNSLPGIYLAVYLHVNSQPGCGKNFATEE
jgi:hypothetical protein